jgi:hypothetical protein
MAGEEVEWISRPGWNSTTTGTGPLLNAIHFHYPWVLAVIFLAAFVANSVLTAEPSSEPQPPTITGPGGKPLPRSAAKYKEELQKWRKMKEFSRGRKTLFLYLHAGLLATFLAHGTMVVVHALAEKDEGWWCGEATAVWKDLMFLSKFEH